MHHLDLRKAGTTFHRAAGSTDSLMPATRGGAARDVSHQTVSRRRQIIWNRPESEFSRPRVVVVDVRAVSADADGRAATPAATGAIPSAPLPSLATTELNHSAPSTGRASSGGLGTVCATRRPGRALSRHRKRVPHHRHGASRRSHCTRHDTQCQQPFRTVSVHVPGLRGSARFCRAAPGG